VTVWSGTTTAAGQRWYDLVSQPKANDLMEWALTGYAGASTTSARRLERHLPELQRRAGLPAG
jgi:hypothetical protein